MNIQGSGNKITETRPVSGFDRVELSGVGRLVVRQNGTETVSIEGDDNILPVIRTEVWGGTLRIGLEPNTNVIPKTPLVFSVTARSVNGLALSGAGSMEAGDLRANSFEVSISGAGNVRLDNLAAGDLRATLSGAGDFLISGSVTSQEVVISGAGSYRADNLQSRTAGIRASGAGSATIRAAESLTANLSGVGSIKYYGNPAVQQQKSGLGSIRKIGD